MRNIYVTDGLMYCRHIKLHIHYKFMRNVRHENQEAVCSHMDSLLPYDDMITSLTSCAERGTRAAQRQSASDGGHQTAARAGPEGLATSGRGRGGELSR